MKSQKIKGLGKLRGISNEMAEAMREETGLEPRHGETKVK